MARTDNKRAYQTIAADGRAKRKNCPIPWKISRENGDRVAAHEEENIMYKERKAALNHIDIPIAIAPPRFCRPDLNTKAQHRGICTQRVAHELRSMGLIKLWDWKYRTRGCSTA